MRTVIVQNWLESERGWGKRPDGFTVHLTVEERDAYIAWYNKKFNNLPTAPDEYTRAEGDGIAVTISEALYKRIVDSISYSRRCRRGGGVWSEKDVFFHQGDKLLVKDLRLVEIK